MVEIGLKSDPEPPKICIIKSLSVTSSPTAVSLLARSCILKRYASTERPYFFVFWRSLLKWRTRLGDGAAYELTIAFHKLYVVSWLMNWWRTSWIIVPFNQPIRNWSWISLSSRFWFWLELLIVTSGNEELPDWWLRYSCKENHKILWTVDL